MTTMLFPSVEFGRRSLIESVSVMAKDVGLPVPTEVMNSEDRTWIEAADYANRAGEELARRVDWGKLLTAATLTGTGTSAAIALPDDYARFAQGTAITYGGKPLRALTRAEWGDLEQAEGTPRYFLAEGRQVSFWPYLADADTVNIRYISNLWCDGGVVFATDGDLVVFPSEVFEKGLIVRWRRQKGMDYADCEAEYEAALAEFASFDDRSRL